MYNCSSITASCMKEREINLYFRSWIPKNPKGLMIFIHGAGEHSGQYSDLGEACLNRQLAFTAPDLRGFGQSGGQRGHIHRFQQYLHDLDQLVIHFHKQYPQLPIYLCGHSLGGLIVIRYVQYFPNKAAGVILSSPAMGVCIRIPYLIRKCAQLISVFTPTLSLELIKWNESLKKLRWLGLNTHDWTSELLADPLATIQYTPRWIAELLRNEAAALKEANHFHLPILCLYGLHDTVTDSKQIEQFIEAIPSTDKVSVLFTEGGHRPLHEHGKDEAMEHIFQWLYTRL